MRWWASWKVHVVRGTLNGHAIKLITGKVVRGKIEVEGESLKEGSTVTVLAPEDDETFELSPQQEAELARRIPEVENGRFVNGDELLSELSHE
jgi:hypothetical protein